MIMGLEVLILQYGITVKLQTYLKMKKLVAPVNEELAFCWDIQKLRVQNRNVFVAINTSSRYGVVAAGMKLADVKDMPVFMKKMISMGMYCIGYDMKQIECYFQLAGNAVLTKTHGRKAVGDMNRAIMDMGFFDDTFFSDEYYQPEFSSYINRDICKPAGFDTYGYPEEFFKSDMERLKI